jgi:tyrosine-protein kinase Etk/Wzc
VRHISATDEPLSETGSSGTVAFPTEPKVEIGDEPVDFLGLYAALRRHVWIIVAAAIAAFGVTLLHLQFTPREYRANAVIRLVDTRRAIAGNFEGPGGQPFGGSQIDPIQSQIEVLRSRSVAGEVVDRHPLGLRVIPMNLPASLFHDVIVTGDTARDSISLKFDAQGVEAAGRHGRTRASYGDAATIGPLQFTVATRPDRTTAALEIRGQGAAIDTLLNNLLAKAREATDVVDVSYTSPDPLMAKQIADAVVTVFEASDAATARDASQRRRVFIGEQLRQTDSLLLAAQNELSAYRSRNQVNASSDVVAARLTGLLDRDMQRQDLTAEREILRSLLDSLAIADTVGRQRTLRALVASPTIAANVVVQELFTQLFGYEIQRDSLTTGRWSSTLTSPDVVRLDSLIATTQSKLMSAVESQITSLDAQIAALGGLLDENSRELDRLPAVVAGEARLQDQVRSMDVLANELREEYQSARISEAVEAGDVEIIDFATGPGVPIGPGRRWQLLAGTLVGLVLGVTLALIRERMRTVMTRAAEMQQVLQIPHFAVIPPIAGAIVPNAHVRIGRLLIPVPFSRAMRRHRRTERAEALITVADSNSSGAEAFRLLRTNILFSQSVRKLRTIVVTSASAKDGKTTTAANLAVTFAQHGTRVLLLDADLRRARLHTIFDVSREPGLTDVVLGRSTTREAVRPTLVDGLSFLPAGVLIPNPSEFLGGEPLHELLQDLAAEYDLVVLDTAPVFAASDSTILGRLADGALFVIRAGKTERSEAVDALNRLMRAGVRVIGGVMNDPDDRVSQSTSYYYGSTYNYNMPRSEPAS